MDQMACVDLPVFPLQLLLRQHPDWREHPVAVVDADKPQGVILWVNERARSMRIRPGMRYAAGLSLASGLRASVMPRGEIERSVASLVKRLRNFTPNVEPSADEPGTFWLDASGLERLHDSLRSWAGLIRADLKRVGLLSTVVVGYSRFGTYALAKVKRGTIVMGSVREERAAARRVPLDRLSLAPSARDALEKLGVTSVGQFAELPVEGIEKRFGPEVYRLHRLATGGRSVTARNRMPPSAALVRLRCIPIILTCASDGVNSTRPGAFSAMARSHKPTCPHTVHWGKLNLAPSLRTTLIDSLHCENGSPGGVCAARRPRTQKSVAPVVWTGRAVRAVSRILALQS